MNLQIHIEKVNRICNLIENGEEYLEELKGYLSMLNKIINEILACSQNAEIPFAINEQFVVQVLSDIVYGIEHKDAVCLLDVLRYGLLEIFYYVIDELKSEE